MKVKCRWFQKPCLEHGCTHWVQLQGQDPQTGVDTSQWMCLDHAALAVALEGNKETRSGAAATESFRNVMVRLATAEPNAKPEMEGPKKSVDGKLLGAG